MFYVVYNELSILSILLPDSYNDTAKNKKIKFIEATNSFCIFSIEKLSWSGKSWIWSYFALNS